VGAWAPGPFDNDLALDLLAELAGANRMEVLVRCVTLPDGEYIDDDWGSRALVAAELIAAANDGKVGRLPTSALEIVPNLPQPPESDLIAMARKAVSRVLRFSETRELRAELPEVEFLAWNAEIQQLMNRLS
jgi:hypothetical protein